MALRKRMKGSVLLAYLAGIIDGEGSIGIRKIPSKYFRGAINPSYSIYMSCTMLDVQAVGLLSKVFGGKVHSYPHKIRKDGTANFRNEWRISCRVAEKAIKRLIPFLRVKYERAETALALQKVIGTLNRRNRQHLSSEEVSFREKQYQKIKILNMRGGDKIENLA